MTKIIITLILTCCFINYTFAQKRYIFIDERDNNVYKTIQIGEQIWMVENLRYATESCSWCYNNDTTCFSYGRLYTWDEAINSCPDSWHLPTKNEWEQVIKYYKKIYLTGKKNSIGEGFNKQILKFNLKLGGYKEGNSFIRKHKDAYFWSATDPYPVYAYFAIFSEEDKIVSTYILFREFGMYVRCIKD